MYVKFWDGRFVGEIVAGGYSSEIVSEIPFNDGEWHSVVWEANPAGQRLAVDDHLVETKQSLILPNTYIWTIGK